MRVLQLNHVALHVADVVRSVLFYRDVLQLPLMERPAFDFPGAWFRVGVSHELHLIGSRDLPVHSDPRGTHLALEVDDLDAWEAHLESQGVERLPRKIRPDGALQVFLIDPDGHWVELCQPPAEAG